MIRKFTNVNGIVFYAEKHTREEWNELVGDRKVEFWDFELSDLLDGAIEIEEGALFYKVRERYFETGVLLNGD